MKILLVDDSRLILHENQRVLERVGYHTACATDGESALRMVAAEAFDLIVLDLLLPGISGLDVLKRLKSDPSTASIPVVILSCLSEKNREKLLLAGAEDYFEKSAILPLRGQNQLPAALEGIVGRIKRTHEVQFASPPPKQRAEKRG